jgi:hypothetical protein
MCAFLDYWNIELAASDFLRGEQDIFSIKEWNTFIIISSHQTIKKFITVSQIFNETLELF